jgi:putative transposon-encoded protein
MISLDIPNMRKIDIIDKRVTLTDEVEIVYEKIITPFGNSAKVDAPKKYIGSRAYVIILKGGS